MTDFSKLLNPEQFAAATAGDGPLLVLAAAGTGKTRTLVHRVAYLIEQGVPPDRILLLTFTNRAAREMRERAEKLVGETVYSIWSGTFHSVCARLLRRYGAALGFAPGFQILDEDDQKKLVGEIIKETVPDPKDFVRRDLVAKMISEAANERRAVRDIAQRWLTKAAGVDPEKVAEVAAKYDARKRELGSMDFDDLLVNGLRLLTDPRTANVREMLQEHFLHVLVDEYQDTNGLQAEFTDILAAKRRNILAVGDDFQCIYTWRGAQIENILDFPKRWPGCRTVKLERNYRSVPEVLDVANVVMKDSPGQFEKTLRASRGGRGEKPYVYRVYDGRAMAHEIARLVEEARALGYRYGDMAVLYRSHFQSMDVQMTLARLKVPFRITSGVGIFEQVHVKDVLAYLRLLLNERDELSFGRFAMLLPGVGEKSAAGFWKRLGGRFDGRSAASRDALGGMLGAKARPLWPALAKAIEAAYDHLAEGKVGEIVSDFCDLFYEGHLRREWEEAEAEDRLNDVQALASQIADHDGGLAAFLSDVALMTNLDAKRNVAEGDRLTLSTIHQAKGMEWPVVFVPWLSEGLFPSAKAAEEGRMDEERRLFYVVVTRAKDALYLFSPRVRKTADGGMFPVDASPFIREIPPELVTIRKPALSADSYAANAGGEYGAGRGGYGRGGYGPSGGYGRGGYGSGRGGRPEPQLVTRWRH